MTLWMRFFAQPNSPYLSRSSRSGASRRVRMTLERWLRERAQPLSSASAISSTCTITTTIKSRTRQLEASWFARKSFNLTWCAISHRKSRSSSRYSTLISTTQTLCFNHLPRPRSIPPTLAPSIIIRFRLWLMVTYQYMLRRARQTGKILAKMDLRLLKQILRNVTVWWCWTRKPRN